VEEIVVSACLLNSVFSNAGHAQPVPDFCEGNFDCDVDVDGTDAFNFKADFGRSGILNPALFLMIVQPMGSCPDGMLICNNAALICRR